MHGQGPTALPSWTTRGLMTIGEKLSVLKTPACFSMVEKLLILFETPPPPLGKMLHEHLLTESFNNIN